MLVDRVVMPRSGSQFAADLDGDGIPDNKLGLVVEAINQAAPALNWAASMEQHLAQNIKQGQMLILVQLTGASFDNEPAAKLRLDLGQDKDQIPGDNLSGAEELGIVSFSPGSTLDARITAGQLSAVPGDAMVPLILAGQQNVVQGRKVHSRGQVAGDRIVNGEFFGAVPSSEMDQKILPGMAAYITQTYQTSDPQGKAMVEQLLDLDKDGKVTAQEMKSSIIGLALRPDVDTDGDGAKDAVSIGFGYTTVPCKIVP
jgi:hypothetical protein